MHFFAWALPGASDEGALGSRPFCFWSVGPSSECCLFIHGLFHWDYFMCNANNHPPSCTCGFGGEGHLGGGPSWQSNVGISSTSNSANEWEKQDFTYQTTCPECGSFPVYFIRHNNGSVWVDELGWPWPKHGCFDKPNEPTHTFGAWVDRIEYLNNPKFALVLRSDISIDGNEIVLKIRTNGNTLFLVFANKSFANPAFLGAMVIVSLQDHVLLHPDLGRMPFRSKIEILEHGTIKPRIRADRISNLNMGGRKPAEHRRQEAVLPSDFEDKNAFDLAENSYLSGKDLGSLVESILSKAHSPLTARQIVRLLADSGCACTRKKLNSHLYQGEKVGKLSKIIQSGQSAPVWCKA